MIWLVQRPGLFLTFLFALHALCILITAQAVISYITREWIYGLLDEEPNYKLLNRFFCTLKERNLLFDHLYPWQSFNLNHRHIRSSGSQEVANMIRCIAWLTLLVNPVMILKGNLSTSRRVSETQQSQSPSCQVLLSLLVKQKNLACLSSANPMVSTNFCGVVRAGLYCMSLYKVGHTAFEPPLASGATDMMICATRWCIS